MGSWLFSTLSLSLSLETRTLMAAQAPMQIQLLHRGGTANQEARPQQTIRSATEKQAPSALLEVRGADDLEAKAFEERAFQQSGLPPYVRRWSIVDRDLLLVRSYELSFEELQNRYPQLPPGNLRKLHQSLYGREIP